MTARASVLPAALLRAGLLAAVMAIVAGIFGMHVMTADHSSHAAHAGAAVAASAVLVAWFMHRLGGFGWAQSVAAGLGVALTCFLVFEIWFLVQLPKGPLETSLGY